MARSAAEITQYFILSREAIWNAPWHVYLFIVVNIRNWICLTYRAAIQISFCADCTSTLTRLTIFCCWICIISRRTNRNTAISTSKEVKSYNTKIDLSTIFCSYWATNTLWATHLTYIRRSIFFELTCWTIYWTDTISIDQIVHSDNRWIDRINYIFTWLTLS